MRTVEQERQNKAMAGLLVREAEKLASEKGIEKNAVVSCLAIAFCRVVNEIYGWENDIRVAIDKGVITISRHRKVVEDSEEINLHREIPVEQAPGRALGDDVVEFLPLPYINRLHVQSFRMSLHRSLDEIKRENEYAAFMDRKGEIVSAVVKEIEGGNLILEIGAGIRGILLRNELIPRESYAIGERLKAYLYEVKKQLKGPQIFLSRTHPEFLSKLLAAHVPEVFDNTIEIKGVVRDPGSRAKVAVYTHDHHSFDAIGACVGVRGTRIKAVSEELRGEKIDLIVWSPDVATFVVNALTPAEVTKVILEKKKGMTVVVPDSQQSIAIGRRGQNVKLAYQLTGVTLKITTESLEAIHRVEGRQRIAQMFMQKMDLDEMMAHFLVSEGFETIEELAQSPINELVNFEGFTESIAQELQDRAKEALHDEKQQTQENFKTEGGQQDLVDLGLPSALLPILARHNIFSRQDFADLALDELLDIVKNTDFVEDEDWAEWIIKARTL